MVAHTTLLVMSCRGSYIYSVNVDKIQNKFIPLYPDMQIRLLCTPGTIFHGCQTLHWDPLKTKQSCPKKIGMGYVKCMVSMATPCMILDNRVGLQIKSFLGFYLS